MRGLWLITCSNCHKKFVLENLIGTTCPWCNETPEKTGGVITGNSLLIELQTLASTNKLDHLVEKF